MTVSVNNIEKPLPHAVKADPNSQAYTAYLLKKPFHATRSTGFITILTFPVVEAPAAFAQEAED